MDGIIVFETDMVEEVLEQMFKKMEKVIEEYEEQGYNIEVSKFKGV